MKEIYLDNAATTKPYKEVCNIVRDVSLQIYGNPSSLHHLGFVSEKLMNDTMSCLAKYLKVEKEEIIITSGATESNNLAIMGCAYANIRKGKHLITSKGEHPAVLEVFYHLEKEGFEVSYLDLDENGKIKEDDLKKELREDTILVSIMHINNEIGSIQDLKKLACIVKKYNSNIIFHSDCTQSFCKVKIYPNHIGIDLMATSAHKFHGPRGIGFLYKSKNVKMNPIMFGGGQQRDIRSGTENLPGIVGMTKAVEINYEKIEDKTLHIEEIKKYLIEELLQLNKKLKYEATKIIIDNSFATPYILSVSFAPIRSEVLLHSLEEQGIYVSSGSACSSNHPGISSVLQSIGVSKDDLDCVIRFSFCAETTKEDIEVVVNVLEKVLPKLKKFIRK